MRKREKGSSWLLAWGLQIVAAAFAGAAASLADVGPAWLRMPVVWLLLPLFGGATAGFAVLKGLSNYLAWIAPPALYYAAHLLIWGYAPPMFAALLTAFISLVGAAAGEVLRVRKKNQ